MAKVTVAICAYNVEETLEKTIASMPQDVADEVIVVDDGSSDRTVDLARKLEETLDLSVIVHPENRGYGAVQKTAYVAAIRRGADVVALLHGDYQYDPASLPLLVSPLLAHGADMTFGSRFASSGDPRAGGMPLYRFVGNRITTVIENVLIGTHFTDLHSGMRAFNRRCLLSLPFLTYRNDFAFDKQSTVDAVLGGLRVVEIPIPTRYDHESSSIPTLGSFRYVWHSVAYTAAAAAKRGRRGHRWPVAGARSPRPAKEDPTARSLWDLARSYVLPNTSIVASGTAWERELHQLASAGTDGQRSGAEDQRPGVAFVDWAPSESLAEFRSVLHEEGLLVGVVRGEGISTQLSDAGFRIVGWSPAGIFAARPNDGR